MYLRKTAVSTFQGGAISSNRHIQECNQSVDRSSASKQTEVSFSGLDLRGCNQGFHDLLVPASTKRPPGTGGLDPAPGGQVLNSAIIPAQHSLFKRLRHTRRRIINKQKTN